MHERLLIPENIQHQSIYKNNFFFKKSQKEKFDNTNCKIISQQVNKKGLQTKNQHKCFHPLLFQYCSLLADINTIKKLPDILILNMTFL